ncbi:unnamed protein product [Cuscuta epithymum]|uniref:VQ domain-containing protein n=1 Tax=Cuscuta epithymum TaxID=186058 RepID=A0AAV0C5I1_9ASTE|nr:unnamed protein product [Cuscuta epithymum]
MASSDNLAPLEPWASRFAGFSDSWFSDAFSRETETLTQALQKSMSDAPEAVMEGFPFEAGMQIFKPEEARVGTPCSASGPTVSGGSEYETAGSKRGSLGVTGKAKKRRSRASRGATTTYITADAANFRQMVQQVTGFKHGGPGQIGPILKPEPHRAVNRPQPTGFFPALDTPSFMLEQSRQQQQTARVGGSGSSLPPPPPRTAGESSCPAGIDFDYFSAFPILESWKTVV